MIMNPNANKNNKSYRPNNNKPKPVTKVLPFIVTGKTDKGYDYDTDSCNALMNELAEGGIFSKLSIMANMSKAIVFNNPDARGTAPAARINSYDSEKGEVELVFFGRNTELAEKMENMVVVPRVRTNRDGEVLTIMNFDIVDAYES